jgi:phosphoribosylformimino-5-aminoimidazole carboxamide ribotide isomerase
MEGIDLDLVAQVLDASPHAVWISGGITTMDDLAALEDLGTHGVVLGMALYTGTLDARAVAERYGR